MEDFCVVFVGLVSVDEGMCVVVDVFLKFVVVCSGVVFGFFGFVSDVVMEMGMW